MYVVENRVITLFGMCTALCADGNTFSGPEVGFWELGNYMALAAVCDRVRVNRKLIHCRLLASGEIPSGASKLSA
jgi:hypothetical protein